MKRLMISAIAAIALIAAATTMLWPRSATTSSVTGISQPAAAASAGQLPTQEIEDMSLVYSYKAGQ